MAGQPNIPELDHTGLREFGLTTGVAVIVIFGLFFPWILGRDWPAWPGMFPSMRSPTRRRVTWSSNAWTIRGEPWM